MRPEPVLLLRALGREVQVLAGPGVPEDFLTGLRASWCDVAVPAGAGGAEDPEPLTVLLTAPDEAELLPQWRAARPGAVTLLVDPAVPAEAASAFTTRVTTALISARAGSCFLFHAAALADPVTGTAVLLVGPSGRGKTTAARALGRAGWTYLTDETAAVDFSTLAVEGYPKPLSVLERPGEPKVQRAASALGLRVPPRPPADAGRSGADPARSRLAGILLLDRATDAPVATDAVPERTGGPRPEPAIAPAPLAEALQVLAEQSSGLARTDRPLRRLAGLAAGVGGIHRVSYREAEDLPGAVLAWLQARSAEAAESRPSSAASSCPSSAAPMPETVLMPETVPMPALLPMPEGAEWFEARPSDPSPQRPERPEDCPGDTVPPGSAEADAAWVRAPGAEGLRTPEELLVLTGTRSYVLNPVAADLWILAGAPGGITALEAAPQLAAVHGEVPEDPEDHDGPADPGRAPGSLPVPAPAPGPSPVLLGAVQEVLASLGDAGLLVPAPPTADALRAPKGFRP